MCFGDASVTLILYCIRQQKKKKPQETSEHQFSPTVTTMQFRLGQYDYYNNYIALSLSTVLRQHLAHLFCEIKHAGGMRVSTAGRYSEDPGVILDD